MRRIDGERAEQQGRAIQSSRDVPQPDGADDAAASDRDEGEPARGIAADAQALGRLLEADGAVGDVEQRLAVSRVGFSAERTGRLWLPGLAEKGRLLGCELRPNALAGVHGTIRAPKRPVRTPLAAAIGLTPALRPKAA